MPVLVHFFFTAAHFHLALVTASISRHFSFCHRRYKIFMLFFQQKLAQDLCRPFSLFLCLTLALYSKLVGMTINVRIQRQFPVSAFVFSCLCFIRSEWLWDYDGADGRSGERTVTWLPNIPGWVVYHIFLPVVLRARGGAYIRRGLSTDKFKPRGAYIWRSDLTEGFLLYEFGGLIFGGAYTQRGLFSEFYGMC